MKTITSYEAAADALLLIFASHYELGIGEKPTKEEVKLVLSQAFGTKNDDVCLRGKMYGLGYGTDVMPSHAMICVSQEECARVGNKLNGKNVVVNIADR